MLRCSVSGNNIFLNLHTQTYVFRPICEYRKKWQDQNINILQDNQRASISPARPNFYEGGPKETSRRAASQQ